MKNVFINCIVPRAFETLEEYRNLCLLNIDISKQISQKSKYITFWIPFLKYRREILFKCLEEREKEPNVVTITFINYVKENYILIPDHLLNLGLITLLKIRTKIIYVTRHRYPYYNERIGNLICCRQINIGHNKYRDEYAIKIINNSYGCIDSIQEGVLDTTTTDGICITYTIQNSTYIGQMKNSTCDGPSIWRGKCIYEGEIINDSIIGAGKLTFKDGSYITGTWNDNMCIDGIYCKDNTIVKCSTSQFKYNGGDMEIYTEYGVLMYNYLTGDIQPI